MSEPDCNVYNRSVSKNVISSTFSALLQCLHLCKCVRMFAPLFSWLFFPESRCVEYACSPPMGNLASGRTLFTLFNSSCLPTHPRCVTDLHPPSMMSDDPFLHPDTWWASAVGDGEKDEIRLDLEKRFCLTHVVLSFRSPRPAAMMLERSQDFGQSWETLKLFARNCSEMFGVPDDVSQAGALCTSRYSNVVPCSRGEVKNKNKAIKHHITNNIKFFFFIVMFSDHIPVHRIGK